MWKKTNENKTIQKEKEDDPFLKKYSGILQNLSITDLNEAGFKIAWQKPYCFQNKFDEFLQFQKKKYDDWSQRKRKQSFLFAAMGEGKEVFKETNDMQESYEHNKVFGIYEKKKLQVFRKWERFIWMRLIYMKSCMNIISFWCFMRKEASKIILIKQIKHFRQNKL